MGIMEFFDELFGGDEFVRKMRELDEQKGSDLNLKATKGALGVVPFAEPVPHVCNGNVVVEASNHFIYLCSVCNEFQGRLPKK